MIQLPRKYSDFVTMYRNEMVAYYDTRLEVALAFEQAGNPLFTGAVEEIEDRRAKALARIADHSVVYIDEYMFYRSHFPLTKRHKK